MTQPSMQGMMVEVVQDHDWTLEDAGRAFGLTRETIRMIEAKALDRLRHSPRAEMLEEFIEDGFLDPGGDPMVHVDVPMQRHERLGWGVSPYGSADEGGIALMLARHANAMERLGLTKWDSVPDYKLYLRALWREEREARQEVCMATETDRSKFLGILEMTEDELRSATDCVLWPGKPHRDGHGNFSHVDRSGPSCAHRVSYQLFVAECPAGQILRHTCGNRLCVNPNHLRLTTKRQRKPTAPPVPAKSPPAAPATPRRPGSKLSDEDVVALRSAIRDHGENPRELAKKYGVTHEQLLAAARGDTFAHLDGLGVGATGWERLLLHRNRNTRKILQKVGLKHDKLLQGSSCVIWPGKPARSGTGNLITVRDRDPIPIHRAVYELFVGHIGPDDVIRHSCGEKNCVRPAHLMRIDRQEHSAEQGRKYQEEKREREANADAASAETADVGQNAPDAETDKTVSGPPEVPPAADPTDQIEPPVVGERYVSCEHEGFYAVDLWIEGIPLIHTLECDEYVTRIVGDITWEHTNGDSVTQTIGRIGALLIRTGAYHTDIPPEASDRRRRGLMLNLLDVLFEDPARSAAVYNDIQWCRTKNVLAITELGVEPEFRGRGAASAAVRRLHQTFGGRSTELLIHALPAVYEGGLFAKMDPRGWSLEDKNRLLAFLRRLGFASLPTVPGVLTAEHHDVVISSGKVDQPDENRETPENASPFFRRNDMVTIGRKPKQSHIVHLTVGDEVYLLCGKSVSLDRARRTDPFGLKWCAGCQMRQHQLKRLGVAAAVADMT